jgi:LPXTG-site transpeptidase (sortase) family protein
MYLRSVFLLLLGLGIFVLMQVVMPFLSYQIWEISSYDKSSLLVDPTDQRAGKLVSGKVLEALMANSQTQWVIENINNFPAFVVSAKEGTIIKPPYKEFKVSIPSLDLKNAKTLVHSNSFEENLAHLKGTALPGDRGNVFITGHSSLPNFFGGNKGQFVDLPKIKKGDEVLVEALGQKFTYIVLGIKIVDPKDTSVILPPDIEGRYLTLMTCVPPGLSTKRLVVLTKIKNS